MKKNKSIDMHAYFEEKNKYLKLIDGIGYSSAYIDEIVFETLSYIYKISPYAIKKDLELNPVLFKYLKGQKIDILELIFFEDAIMEKIRKLATEVLFVGNEVENGKEIFYNKILFDVEEWYDLSISVLELDDDYQSYKKVWQI